MTNKVGDAADDPYRGYRGAAREKLQACEVRVWSEVTADTTRGGFRGIVLPRSETADDRHIVIKLDTGYNVGLAVESIQAMEELGYRKITYKIPAKDVPHNPDLPNVTLFGTGGTHWATVSDDKLYYVYAVSAGAANSLPQAQKNDNYESFGGAIGAMWSLPLEPGEKVWSSPTIAANTIFIATAGFAH